MARRTLPLRALTPEAFAPFGVVVETRRISPQVINQGLTRKYADLFPLDCNHEGGRVAVHLYRSSAHQLPIEISGLERHPLGSQAFWPLHNGSWVIVVAPPAPEPDEGAIRAFMASGGQAVQYHRGTWHHYQISLGVESDYLVFDREGDGNNCDEILLSEPLLIIMGSESGDRVKP